MRQTTYMLKLLIWPTLFITVSLTSIVWLTQALRFIDFTINRGLSALDFLYLTGLLIPSLLLIILPVSLFVAVVFTYHKLSAESELVVMKAAGLSPLQLARPAIIMGLAVMLLCYGLSLYLMPATKRQFKDMQTFLRDNYTSMLLQEEVFNNPVDGLTVFVRNRDDDGILHGVLVHDSRLPNQPVTMLAEEARLIQTPGGPRFHLIGGMRQELREGRVSWLDFDSYNLDISLYTKAPATHKRGAEELFVSELLNPATTDPGLRWEYRAELHQRLTWPLYALGLALLGAAALLSGEFTRRGQWKRLVAIAASATGLVLAAIGLSNVMVRLPMLTPVSYAVALIFITGCFLFLAFPRQPNIPAYPANGEG